MRNLSKSLYVVGVFVLVLVLGVWIAGCGGGSVSKSSAQSGSATYRHVVLVMEENHAFSEVMGNAAMPYLNGLATQYAVAANYYANTHPSIGNYFELTAGTIPTNDDNFSGSVSADNLARELQNKSMSWKVYADSLPHAGYTADGPYPYARNHNPFAYFTDVLNSPAAQGNIVPVSQLATDLSNSSLPAFSLVVPSLIDDAHDCPAGGTGCADSDKLAAADQWLQTNIGPLLANTSFQASGLLMVTFDEAPDSDTVNGGGHTFLLAASTKAKSNYQSQVLYQHQNTLRTICDGLGLATCPGDGASATPLGDLFN